MANSEPGSSHPDTRAPLIFGFLIPISALMLTFCAGRIYVRLSIIGKFGADDWLIAGSAIFAVLETILGCVDTLFGAGYHTRDIKPEWVVPYAKISFVSGTIFSTCVTLPKLSLCMTYLRIFPSRANRIFCHTAITYLLGWLLSTSLVELFACRPIAASWDPTITNAACITLRKYYLASGVLNSLSDFLVFLWPARALWNIQLPTKQRLGLIAIFASGCIVCVAGIIRLWYIQVVFTSSDFAYDGAVVWVVTCIEVNVGIICGCLHAVKPLLAAWFPKLFSSSTGTNPQVPSYANKQRGFGARITGNRTFPFQSLSSDAKARNLSVPGKSAKDPFSNNSDIRVTVEELRASSSTPTRMSPAANDSPRVEAWATGGEDTGTSAPAHGIAYTQHVTIDTQSAVGEPGLLNVEGGSERSGNGSARLQRNVNDADSEEWIMNEQVR